MASLEELRDERLKKLSALKEKGIDAYPISVNRDATLFEANKSFLKLSKKKKGILLLGRITAIRGQGAIIFFDFFDGTGSFQGLLKKEGMDENIFSLFNDTVDIGDFIEINGTLFTTKRKEKTILVREWRMLSKSLRPLPDKWHGLQDIEERFRRRYLDTLMSKEVRARFITRAIIISGLREYMNANNFLEVETPILQTLAGGALALPFKTHHQALDVAWKSVV